MTSYELKIIRKRLGLTQSAFAQYVGAGSTRAIRHWEKGDRKCPKALDKLFPVLYGGAQAGQNDVRIITRPVKVQ
jgi:DNA-binding transcriptional regulator YiaG